MSTTYGTGLVGTSVTDMGYTALWVGFAFTFVATVVFGFLSYIRNVRPEARLTYYLVTLINAITALAFLIQALGQVTITAHGAETTRAFEWVRYAAWALVAPITIWIFGLLSGAHWVELIWVSIVTIVGLAAGYAGAISNGFNATWPLFAFAVMSFFPVFIALLFTFRRAAYKVHTEIGKLYDVVGLGSLILYVGYIITWGVSEGGFITTVDQELIIYTVLDVLTKVVFGFTLIYSREAIARYGSFMGQINTGIDFDFPIARSTYTSSASAYATEPSPAVVFGEHRDLAFAQLHGATNTQLTAKTA